MADTDILSGFIEPALPGVLIAEHWRIWQMNFLTSSQLASFAHDRGLAFFSERDVIPLWQLGLLKADRIRSSKKLSQVGLVYRGTDKFGRHIYSDERQLPRQRVNWKNALKHLKPLRAGMELLFHPFRYYVLYHLDKELGLHISRKQMLLQDGFPHVLEWCIASFNRWTNSKHFIASIRKWNDIASLAILTEPCMYVHIFESIKYDPDEITNLQDGPDEIKRHMFDYWEQHIEGLYQQIGIERLEKIRQDLCFDTEMLEPNEWIHTLLCLGDSNLRLKLEGHLGGALLPRTMAEMLRRATEETFHTQLREEDEIGTGLMPRDVKKTLYGSNRLLDDHHAGSAFVRRHGLSFKPRVHVYGEGTTECGALNRFLKMMGIFVPVTNLHGLLKASKSMSKFFSDSLRSDMKEQMFSLVMIDGDLEDNVRIIESAAKTNQRSPDQGMFGRFFLATPDFEFANFDIEELEEVLWAWVGGEHPSQADRDMLHSHVKDTTGSTDFFKGVKRAAHDLLQLVGYEKGEPWGEALMEFAWNHPGRRNRRRPLIEAIEMVVWWERVIQVEPYETSRKSYMVDLKTGELVKRPS